MIGLCVVSQRNDTQAIVGRRWSQVARALEIAQGIEAAGKNSKELKAEQPTADWNFAGSSN